MIVNTIGQDVDLSQGAVSRSLLAVAGKAMQEECRKQVPSGKQLDLGRVIRSSGYQLRCTDVLHGACGRWDNAAGPCEQVINTSTVQQPTVTRTSGRYATTSWLISCTSNVECVVVSDGDGT